MLKAFKLKQNKEHASHKTTHFSAKLLQSYLIRFIITLTFLIYSWITGPAFWGLINPDHWSLCNKGRRQSPVNLEPAKLLYDPNLRPIHIDKDRVSSMVLISREIRL